MAHQYIQVRPENPLDQDANAAEAEADGQEQVQLAYATGQQQQGVKGIKPGPKGPRRIADTDDPNNPTFPLLANQNDQRPAILDFIHHAQNQQRILLNVGQACVLTVLQDAKIDPGEFKQKVLTFQNNPKAFEQHCIDYLNNLLLAAKDKDALARMTDQLRVVMAERNAVVKLLNYYKQQAEEFHVLLQHAITCMCSDDIRRYASAMAVAQGTMPDTPPVSFDQNLAAQADANIIAPPPLPGGQKNIYNDSMTERANGQ